MRDGRLWWIAAVACAVLGSLLTIAVVAGWTDGVDGSVNDLMVS